VSDAVLKDCIRQLREALQDDPATPTYIETAHRRGYRFIAKPSAAAMVKTLYDAARGTPAVPAPIPWKGLTRMLGRETELTRLRGWLNRAVVGERQIVFVTGEAGIGKTTLVQALLEQAEESAAVKTARGQCLEHYGASEPYMPLLDAFSRLGRTELQGELVDCLRRHAPAWLAQTPSLIPAAERESLQKQIAGTTRERMLREIAEALEAFTAQNSLILVLEDLHWSDYSTIDLISYLARRRDPARLMIVGTYRPVEVVLSDHPLKSVKRELQAHALCNELPLEYLSEKDVREYLSNRFARHQFYGRLARIIHRRTEGNPLFMVNVAEYLVDTKLIVQDEGIWKLPAHPSALEFGVPENIKQLIEKQIERLSPEERTVLEGASVVGMECSSVAIAAGLDMPTEWVEKHCEELARRHQFLSPAWLVELPDGTITPRHRFNHVVYLEVPYNLVPQMRRSQIHHRIGERGVAIYGDRVNEIAAELAMHFEQSRDWQRAVQYLLLAAENAIGRYAHHEAANLAHRGLEVLKFLPATPERAQQEVKLRMILGVSLMTERGFASEEVESVYARGRELFWLQGASPELFHMLRSLCLYYVWNAEVQPALEIALQLLELAQGLNDGALIMEAHREVGGALVDIGRCAEGLKHLDQATALYPDHRDHQHRVFMNRDCEVVCACFASRALWALGLPDQAAERMAFGLALAEDLSHPQSLVIARHSASQLHQLRGEAQLAHRRAAELIELADEYGLRLWSALGNINLGWAEAELGDTQRGIARMQQGVAGYEATGAKLWLPYFLALLGQQIGKTGRLEEALTIITKALTDAERSGEMFSLAELYRTKGELTMKNIDPALIHSKTRETSSELNESRSSFEKALAVAQQQGAKSWELRINASLRHFDSRASANPKPDLKKRTPRPEFIP